MKRFIMLKPLACTLCLMVALSCNDNKSADPHATVAIGKIDVMNGVLVFSDQQEFDNTLKELTNKDSEVLNKWEAQLLGFRSMRNAYNSITEQDMVKVGESKSLRGFDNCMTIIESNGEKEAVRIISSDAMATLFNKDGVVVIGKDAYKYKFEKIVKVLEANTLDIATLASFDYKGLQSKVTELALVRVIRGQGISVKNGRPEGVTNDQCINQYVSNRRLVGESNVTRTIGGSTFNSITCQAKHQRRFAGIWWAESISRIKLSLTSALKNLDGQNVNVIPSSAERINDNNVSLDIGGCPCYGTIFYTADGDTGSGYKECSESESAF